MKNRIHLLLIIVLFSCQSKQDEGKSNLKETESEEESSNKSYSDEEVDTIGLAQFKKELAAGVFDYKENYYIYFDELKHDYGILITNDEYDEIEETYYELFYKNEKKIFRTSDLSKLGEKLAELPRGIILDWYSTCSTNRHRNLSDAERKAFEDLCRSLSIVLVPPELNGEAKNVICYCNKMR